MAKRRRENDSDATITVATGYNAVFIDTSLNTHLAMTLSPSDTVADFKKKIVLQHSQCFPEIGEMHIHSLQVKRQGYFYHLPDSMIVSIAFEGSKRSWFLYVDASSFREGVKEQHSCNPDASEHLSLLRLGNRSQGDKHNLLSDDPCKLADQKVSQALQTSPGNFCGEISNNIEMDVRHVPSVCQKVLSSGMTQMSALSEILLEMNTVSENAACLEDDNSRDNNKNILCDNLNELLSKAGLAIANKKRKIQHSEDVPIDAGKKVPSDLQVREKDDSDEPYKTSSSDSKRFSRSGATKGSKSTSAAENRHKLGIEDGDHSDFRNGKQASEMVTETREKSAPDQLEVVTCSNVSSQKVKDCLVTSVGSKKEKKKRKKTSLVSHCQAATSESFPLLHGSALTEKSEDLMELPMNHGSGLILSQSGRPSDKGEADGTNKESFLLTNLLVPNEPIKALDSYSSKMKKERVNKEASGIQTFSTGEEPNNPDVISSTVANLALKDHMTDKTENNQSLFAPVGTDRNNKIEDERGLSANYDPQAELCKSYKPSDEDEGEVTNKESVLTPKFSGANEAAEAGNSSSTKKKKRRVKKSAVEIQDRSEIGHKLDTLSEISSPIQDSVLNTQVNDETRVNEDIVPYTEIYLCNKMEGDRGLSMLILSEGSKPLDSAEANFDQKDSAYTALPSDAKDDLEAGKPGGSRKTRKVKKSTTVNNDFSCMQQANTVSHSPAIDFSNETKKDKSILCSTEAKEASKEESINASASGARKKGKKASELDKVFCSLTKIDQNHVNSEDLDANTREEARSNQTMDTISIQDQPVKEQADKVQCVQLDQANGEQENARNTNKKRTRKSKKNQNSAAEALHSSKTEEQTIGMEKFAAPIDKLGELDNLYNKISGSAEIRSGNQSAISEGLKKNAGIESNSSNCEQFQKHVDSSEVQCLQLDQADEEQENTGNASKKRKKKTKKNQNSAAEARYSSKTKQTIGVEELAASGDKLGEEDNLYNTEKISGSAETRSGNQSANSEFGLGKNAFIKSNTSNHEQSQKHVDSSEVPSRRLENSPEMNPETMIDIKNDIKTSEGEDEGINFRHYFVPGENQSEVASDDKVKEALHPIEAKKKTEKHVVSNGGLRSGRARGSQKQSNDQCSSDNPVKESISNAKQNEGVPCTDKEISNASGNGVKDPSSCSVDKIKTHQDEAEPVVAKRSGSRRVLPAKFDGNDRSSSSSSSGSYRILRKKSSRKEQPGFNNHSTATSKFARKNDRDLVNSSQKGQILLTNPGKLFEDANFESSSDENGSGNSDVSTRTPSDNSSSSGYSMSESELRQDSTGKGSDIAKRKDGKGKAGLNSKFLAANDMSMDMIFRSSSRFKKAKLSASQYHAEDTESQPVDFVPDSQANQ